MVFEVSAVGDAVGVSGCRVWRILSIALPGMQDAISLPLQDWPLPYPVKPKLKWLVHICLKAVHTW